MGCRCHLPAAPLEVFLWTNTRSLWLSSGVVSDEFVHYPPEGDDICVEGVFDTYEENGYNYCIETWNLPESSQKE